MRITRSVARYSSQITVDGNMDFAGDYQVSDLASPASGEALRKGSQDITNAEIADAANIAISKLVDDYLPEVVLTANGDILIRSGGVPIRLAKGSDGEYLKLVSGLPAWGTVATRTIATGTYTGNGSQDRQITTGFKCSFVVIFNFTDETEAKTYLLIPNDTVTLAGVEKLTTASLHATDGFVVGAASTFAGNINAKVYYYWAISE